MFGEMENLNWSAIAWTVLVLINFTLQLAWFRHPGKGLFMAKKVSTPLLLFGALGVILFNTGSVPLIQGLILLSMGLGELGIEGSSVVESRRSESGNKEDPVGTSWIVTAAGVLFLAVNIGLGTVLLVRYAAPARILLSSTAGILAVAAMVAALFRVHPPKKETRLQISLYAIGLAVLAAGAAASLAKADWLGRAALVLSISDSMVLWRMGADWTPEKHPDREKLLSFLVIILLLYYLYIMLLMTSASALPSPV